MPILIKKIFSLSTLALVVALTLSAIAAWYSVVGLTAIFAAAVIPIIIMGGSLEVAKVVTTIWLHRYWDKCKWGMKTYLTGAVVTLALVTSMGIFGFLSKAHMDQGIPTGDVAAQIQLFDEKIAIQKELIASERQNIEAARNSLSQMDAQLTARLNRGDSEASVERAVQIRAQQRRERNALNAEIGASQKRIEKYNSEIQALNLEKAPIAAKYRQIEAEVGPVKYIAALIYGDNPDTATLERAVRWVIILLIFVFDPLALMLVIASINSYKWEFDEVKSDNVPFVKGTGYLPLSDNEKEGSSTSLPDPEPFTPINETKEKQQEPLKKKFFKSEKLSFQFTKYELIKLRIKFAIKKLINKLPISKSSFNLKVKNSVQNLNWNNLTNWQNNPTLNLLKKLQNKQKK